MRWRPDNHDTSFMEFREWLVRMATARVPIAAGAWTGGRRRDLRGGMSNFVRALRTYFVAACR